MPLEQIRFLCEYCNKKHYLRKSSCVRHEKECFWNPKTKSCMTCINYIGGGHHIHQCDIKHMNTDESEYERKIKKLQYNCHFYKHDGLTIEERKKQNDILDSDAQYDHDCYNANRT